MFLEERRNNILDYLDKYERVSVAYLATSFAVTKETIRSDLNVLAQLGLVQRCHGGAIVIRRSLQAKLITETDGTFEVLLRRLESQKRKVQEPERGKNMRGKVCILGSFNVDIVARVARFPKGGESLLALGSTLGPAVRGPIRRWPPAGPVLRCISCPKWAKISSASSLSTISLRRKSTRSLYTNRKPSRPATLSFMFRSRTART
ncbi:DNA-bindng transcriptional repressor SrlR [Serratia plymuthica]|nr:DNA-bindng transcriptional repressor SrlR [Serratia plymuthica]